MDINLKYIYNNYIELQDLARKTGFSIEEIEEFIATEKIPNSSYEIKSQHTISSSLGDEYTCESTQKYFPKSHVQKLEQLKIKSENSTDIKDKFKRNFKEIFFKHPDRKFAYTEHVSPENFSEEKLDEIFEIEWKHYCNGVYGICTNNQTEQEIVNKEITIKKLIALNHQYPDNKIPEFQIAHLLELNDQMNECTADFAPYQRKLSSRGKYLDNLLSKNNLQGKIKNYNFEEI